MFKNKKYGYDDKEAMYIPFETAIHNELNPEADLYSFDNDPQYSRSTAISIDQLQSEVNALKTLLSAIIPTLTKNQKKLIAVSFNLEKKD